MRRKKTLLAAAISGVLSSSAIWKYEETPVPPHMASVRVCGTFETIEAMTTKRYVLGCIDVHR